MKHNVIKIYFFILVVLSVSHGLFAEGLVINVNPDDGVFIHESNPSRGYYNAMIHNIAFINKSDSTVTLDHVTIDAEKGDKAIQRIFLNSSALQKSAKRGNMMEKRGLLKLYDFFLKTKSFLGEKVKLSPSLKMEQGNAVISISHYFTLKGVPDSFKITAFFKDSNNNLIKSEKELPAIQYKTTNSFIFPLKGTWWVGAGTEISSHHRWVYFEEFAYDLIQLGIDGLSYSNTGDSLNDYYCFGKDVVAVADGVVVKVQKGLPDDPSLLKGAGESQDEYDQRISMSQFKILKSNFYHSAGNYIVIRHSGDEFSFYAHLKKGSITVKQGDQIKQGQNIGQVGHSGNSTEPHLHFQISDGPDPLRLRSVPVRFSNINLFERKGNGYLRFGDIVRTINQH